MALQLLLIKRVTLASAPSGEMRHQHGMLIHQADDLNGLAQMRNHGGDPGAQ